MHKEKLEQGVISEGEFRKAMTEKVITFFERSDLFNKIQELLKSEKIKEILSFEEFKDFLIRINGVLREIPIGERGTDGKKVYLGGSADITYFPRYEDKEDLLLQTYEALDNVNKEELKYFIPLMITAIHIFKDGNGRMSRIFHLLLIGLNSKEDFYFELDKALDLDGRYQSKNINPEHINKHIVRILLNKYNINTSGNIQNETHLHVKQGLDIKDHELFDKINNSNEEFIDLWCSNKNFGNLVILKYLEESNRLDVCMSENKDGFRSVNIDLMNEILNENDWVNMVNLFYKYKKEMVEIMIDMFVNPDDYHVDDINPTPIKDLLISRVNR